MNNPSQRTFHRRVVTIEILSEDEIVDCDLLSLCYAIKDGDYSGKITFGEDQVVNGKRMAKLLIKQGSDPEFFNLNEKGEDIVL